MMKNIKLCDELINSKTTLVEVQSGLLMWQDRYSGIFYISLAVFQNKELKTSSLIFRI